MIHEPTLQNIDDYNTLNSEKKRVLVAVVLAGIVMSIVYAVAYTYFDNKSDTIAIQQNIETVSVKY